ncbi:metal-sulfur cluster biosynthetic enzyme [Leucobacter komagatae]|uniref:Metal-sulfur cluster biosynthetic enzyme n=1 Tax=Leucobacter komagatae TaxID=55969 RepID=A0A542Y2Z3_9MICO|nr:metal-sulfur cluster assembly factor [Leucobacter komagatae]TQL42447.1 metal-sulfur cluster biosynthetic enzyme [Leucobacter komagatae]
MSEETTTETGAEATAVAAAPVSIDPDFREQAVEALKNVSDPELGVNIVDLGLIYDLAYDEENDALVISMTLTSAGCPLTDVIENDIAESLDGLVAAFRINWVWMPPWTPARITDDGREMMRALGFNI